MNLPTENEVWPEPHQNRPPLQMQLSPVTMTILLLGYLIYWAFDPLFDKRTPKESKKEPLTWWDLNHIYIMVLALMATYLILSAFLKMWVMQEPSPPPSGP